MKTDAIIIGGGLAGLVCGCRLQLSGKKSIILSSGYGTLSFSSGSFDLLGRFENGTVVDSPVSAIKEISPSHPYAKFASEFSRYALQAKETLLDCGIETIGDAERNHFCLTPMGKLKRTWLTLSDFAAFQSPNDLQGKRVLVVGIHGYLDFNAAFVCEGLKKLGADCRALSLCLPALEKLRSNSVEMRSTSIAMALEEEKLVEELGGQIAKKSDGLDAVVMPAIFGVQTNGSLDRLKSKLGLRVWLVPTLPPSLAGIAVQNCLRRKFEKLGGEYLLGNTAIRAIVEQEKVKAVYSSNDGEQSFEADSFILASGSYFSNGLVGTQQRIVEPLFNSDILSVPKREDWYDKSFFGKQNFISFGVDTDKDLRIRINGVPQENLYAIGSVLAGFNPLYEGCGAGVAMLTALYVADQLTNKK